MDRCFYKALNGPAFGLVLLMAGTGPLRAEPGVLSATITPANTRIGFTINGIGWPQTRGVFDAFKGRLRVDFAHPAKSFVSVDIRAASVDAGGASITSYIKSSAMLDVAQHPAMNFRSTSVRRTSAHSVALTGLLSFFGATHPVTFTVRVLSKPGQRPLAFVATGAIQRSAFGFISGQPLISDTARITIASRGRGL
ncbi:MAG: YceI family protein [Hyphomicrobiales bacterium]|nr:YceI family protein [Hyphomicrobiales bacterium]